MKKLLCLFAVLTAIVLLPFVLKPDVGGLLLRSPTGNFSYKEYKFSDKENITRRVDVRMSYAASTDKEWKYIENRLFDGKTSQVPKLRKNILLILDDATKEDSLIFDGLMKELRDLNLNRNIYYAGAFQKDKNKIQDMLSLQEEGVSPIFFRFIQKEIKTYQMVYSQNGYEIGFNRQVENYLAPVVRFKLTDDILLARRKELITYFFWRSLCVVKFEPGAKSDILSSDENPVFNTSEFNPVNHTFTENDKFLIQKLYSEDFLEQFKEYLNMRYSGWYAFQFLNYDLMVLITLTIFILIVVLILGLSIDLFSRKKFKFTYSNYLFPLLIISFLTINFVFLYKILFAHSFIQTKILLLFNLAAILLAVVASLILWLMEKYAFKRQSNFKLELVLKMAFFFLSIQIPLLILISLVKDHFGYTFENSLFMNEILLLTLGRGGLLYLNHYSESLVREKDLELSRIKEINSQSQLQLLQAQINPHFLYNSLNSIAGLAHIDAVKTEKMALSLSDLFRYTINQKDNRTATVTDEVEMVRNYLEIEQIRFGERLEYRIKVDKTLNAVKIPKFIIQPLIENAVKHGISQIEGQGEIVLSLYKEKKSLIIAVKDNGPSFSQGLVSGHGLQTIYDLLHLTFGKKATITWQNIPEKEIKITIQNILDDDQ